jgi:hypothetical protein
MLINCRGKAIQAVAGRRINSARDGITFRPATRSLRYSQKETPCLRQVFLRLAKVSRHRRPSSLRIPGADVPFLDHVPQVGLAAVVVDRQVGALQHPE